MRPDPRRDRLYAEPEDEVRAARNRIWSGRVLALGAVAMVMLNADNVERWAASQPPLWAVETVRLTLSTWSDRMEAAGLDAPREALERDYERVKLLQWRDMPWNAGHQGSGHQGSGHQGAGDQGGGGDADRRRE